MLRPPWSRFSSVCNHWIATLIVSFLSFIFRHLHLHIISNDLCGDGLKKARHYNSFHPKLGYFLHLDDVLEWFEAVDSVYRSVR